MQSVNIHTMISVPKSLQERMRHERTGKEELLDANLALELPDILHDFIDASRSHPFDLEHGTKVPIVRLPLSDTIMIFQPSQHNDQPATQRRQRNL